MNEFIRFFALHRKLAWLAILLLSGGVGLLAGISDRSAREQQQLSLLQTEAERTSVEIMAKTLNVNLMGAIELLGLIDPQIKQEASSGLIAKDAHVLSTLTTLANFFGAQGALIVSKDGIVMSNWDRKNTPATGFDVRFRPYYKIAMQGQSNVYAAVSMTNADRSLYFTSPVYSEPTKASTSIGAVVALTDVSHIDTLLRSRFDIALLLSPQGLVFASSRADWIGMMAEKVATQRLAEIRALKQFGTMFADKDPSVLPISTRSGLQTIASAHFAVAEAPIKWNDPYGDWKLLVYEDLTRATTWQPSLLKAGGAGLICLLLGWMWLRILRGRYIQMQSNLQLRAYAEQQAARVAYRAQVALAAEHLQRCPSMAELAQIFLRSARETLGAVQGVLYVVDDLDPNLLRLAGAAACADAPSATLMLGEGLLGQCALARTPLVIATPPAGIWTVRSGLGDTQPAALLMTPLIVQDALVGALELAVLAIPDDDANSKFAELAALLANNLEILRSNLQLQSLAKHTSELTGSSA